MAVSKFTTAISLGLALSACAGVTGVVPTGPDTYMVASRGTMGWSSGPVQEAHAFQQAADYCKSQGKIIQTISADNSGNGAEFKISTGEVNFRCVRQ